MANGHDELVHLQYEELVQTFSDLELCKNEAGQWVVAGDLSFSAGLEGKKVIDDSFSIQIVIPDDYPDTPPSTFEVGGRIPRKPDFHINESGDMCLAASIEVRKKFSANPCLIHFVEKMVVPFLYWFSYRERFGERPWGELSHGSKGIREYYQEVFETDDNALKGKITELEREMGLAKAGLSAHGGKGQNYKKLGVRRKTIARMKTVIKQRELGISKVTKSTKPAAKPAEKKEAKPAEKKEAKPETKTESKPVTKTEEKPAIKAEAKSAEKKTEAKTETKEEKKSN